MATIHQRLDFKLVGSDALIAAIAQGVADAWSEFVSRHAQRMYRVAYRLIGDHQLAEDACQEAFLVIRDHCASFRAHGSNGDGAAQAWVVRVVSHAAMAIRRAHRAKIRRDQRAMQELPMQRTCDDSQEADPESLSRMRNAIEQLPPRLREPLVLVYLAGSSQESAATLLAISVGNLRMRLHRAIEFLRRRLSGKEAALGHSAVARIIACPEFAHHLQPGLISHWQSLITSPLHPVTGVAAALKTGMSVMTTVSLTAVIGGALSITALCVSFAGTAEKTKAEKVERIGVFAGLPSAPGPHLEKIKSLQDGEWCDLGSPAADPKWGKGRGRSWSSRMAYAPDLRGAFLFGEGVHTFCKPDGHNMDDIFLYDINAHRWICIYPGTKTDELAEKCRSGEYRANDDGQLVDKDGQPIPVMTTGGGHSYQWHTYDTDHRKFIVGTCPAFGSRDGYHVMNLASVKIENAGNELVAGSPFFFNTMTGKFERFRTTANPQTYDFSHIFHYIPTLKALLLLNHPGDGAGPGSAYLWDMSTNQGWTDLKPTGNAANTYDCSTCYDSKRDRIWLRGHFYDVKSNSWSAFAATGTPPNADSTNCSCETYDAINDKIIHVVFRDGTPGVYVFDPEKATWSQAPLPASGQCWNGFYSPEYNAHFYHTAVDSTDNGTVWVYRYKKTKD